MKKVIAVIQPIKLSAVREALQRIEVYRITICDAQGFGRPWGFRSQEYPMTLLRKVVLEIVINDDFLQRTIETILNVARTGPEGAKGDGKIFIVPMDDTVQIREGVRGPGAVS